MPAVAIRRLVLFSPDCLVRISASPSGTGVHIAPLKKNVKHRTPPETTNIDKSGDFSQLEITLLHTELLNVIDVPHFLTTTGVTSVDDREMTRVLEHKGSGTTLWWFSGLTPHVSYILSGTTLNRLWCRGGTTL